MRRAAILLATGLLAAGCGSGDETAAPKTETIGGVQEEPVAAIGNAEAGKKVFANAGCGGCHALAAAGSTGKKAPPLDDTDLTGSEVIEQVRDGGNGMPAFNDRLSEKEIQDVAQFVLDAARE